MTVWPMLNVYNFKLGKETLNLRLGTTQPLQCLQLATVELAISNLLCNVYVQLRMSTDTFYL